MLMASNPEMMIVGNPGKKRKKRGKKRGGPRRIKYRGKYMYFIEIMRKYGKAAARKANRAACKRRGKRVRKNRCVKRLTTRRKRRR